MATVNGAVGWVGMIFVDEALRGRGLGTALTEAVIGELERAGCRSLALIASPYGRPIYERLGFATEVAYRIVAAPGRGRGPRRRSGGSGGERIGSGRRSRTTHAVLALDREATGDDRGHLCASRSPRPARRSRSTPTAGSPGFEASAPVANPPGDRARDGRRIRLLEAGGRAPPSAPTPGRRSRVEPDRLTALETSAGTPSVSSAGWSAGRRSPGTRARCWGQFNFVRASSDRRSAATLPTAGASAAAWAEPWRRCCASTSIVADVALDEHSTALWDRPP